MGSEPSTTLADLFMQLHFADLSSAVCASPSWQSKNEIDDGVAHGRQTWLRWWAVDSFFPPRFGDAAVLQEGVSNHRNEGVTVKTVPGYSFEVIETEFLFRLLMRLIVDPSRLDGCSHPPQVHPGAGRFAR
jgi:hypothetical protein